MKKFIAGVSAVAVIAAGGVALVGISSDAAVAQEGTVTEEAPATEHRPHDRLHRGARGLARIADAIGISTVDLVNAINEGSTIAEVAEANGSSGDAVVAAMTEDVAARIDEAVASGDLSEDEGAQKLATVTARLTELMDAEIDLPEPGTVRRIHRGLHGLAGAANAIGITVEDLVNSINEGNTIAEVAEANGSSGDAVVDAMVAAASERIDQAVESGRLTADEGEARLARLAERLTTFVNADLDLPEPGERPFRDRGQGTDTEDV